MEINLVEEGLKFMVLGMVTVFLFLILMVVILHFQAKILNKFFPEKAASTPSRNNAAQKSPSKDNKVLIAAITAAITTFKNTKN